MPLDANQLARLQRARSSDGNLPRRVQALEDSPRGPAGSRPALHGLAAYSLEPPHTGTNQAALTSGTMYGARMRLADRRSLTKVWVRNAVIPATVTGIWVAVFDASTGAQYGVSADIQSSLTTTGDKGLSLTAATKFLDAETEIIVCMLSVATTGPVLLGAASTAPYNFALTAAPYRFGQYGTGLSAVPATITPGSGTASAVAALMGVS